MAVSQQPEVSNQTESCRRRVFAARVPACTATWQNSCFWCCLQDQRLQHLVFASDSSAHCSLRLSNLLSSKGLSHQKQQQQWQPYQCQTYSSARGHYSLQRQQQEHMQHDEKHPLRPTGSTYVHLLQAPSVGWLASSEAGDHHLNQPSHCNDAGSASTRLACVRVHDLLNAIVASSAGCCSCEVASSTAAIELRMTSHVCL